MNLAELMHTEGKQAQVVRSLYSTLTLLIQWRMRISHFHCYKSAPALFRYTFVTTGHTFNTFWCNLHNWLKRLAVVYSDSCRVLFVVSLIFPCGFEEPWFSSRLWANWHSLLRQKIYCPQAHLQHYTAQPVSQLVRSRRSVIYIKGCKLCAIELFIYTQPL